MRTLLLIAFLSVSGVCAGQALDDNLRRAGFTEMHAAAWDGDAAQVDRLVKNGASVNVSSGFGTTPLHSAAMKGQVESIKTLISLGAALEARDDMGRTPLFVTVEVNAHPKPVLELLLSLGADPEAKNKFGKTPLEACWTEAARLELKRHLQARRP